MKYNLELIKNKKKIISFSTVLILLSLLGILYSTFNTSYKKPINLGMDFVGGNELRIERVCEDECSNSSPDLVLENLREISKNKNFLNNIKLQFQNNNKLISIRTPYLSIEESNILIQPIIIYHLSMVFFVNNLRDIMCGVFIYEIN